MAGFNASAQKGGAFRLNRFDANCYNGNRVSAEVLLSGKKFSNESVSVSDTLEIRVFSIDKSLQFSITKLKKTIITIDGRKYVPPQVQESDIKRGHNTKTMETSSAWGNPTVYKISMNELLGKKRTKCIEQVRVQIYEIKQKAKTGNAHVVVADADFPYQCLIPLSHSGLNVDCFGK